MEKETFNSIILRICLDLAVKHAHDDLIDIFIDKGVSEFYQSLRDAASRGSKEWTRYFLTKALVEKPSGIDLGVRLVGCCFDPTKDIWASAIDAAFSWHHDALVVWLFEQCPYSTVHYNFRIGDDLDSLPNFRRRQAKEIQAKKQEMILYC